MNPNESWIAEQTRLLTHEDGFGPAYAPTPSAGPADPEDDAKARPAAA